MSSHMQEPRNAETGVHGDAREGPATNENHLSGRETTNPNNTQELTGLEAATQDTEPCATVANGGTEEDAHMADGDAEGDTDDDDGNIWSSNESYFGDAESNGDYDLSGQHSPIIFSDIADSDNGGRPCDDGDTLVETESEVERNGLPIPPWRRGYQQPESMGYSDITDDENDGVPLVNGVNGDSQDSAADLLEVNAGGSVRRHAHHLRQTRSDELHGEATGLTENNGDNQLLGTGRSEGQHDAESHQRDTVFQEQRLDEDVLGDIERIFSGNSLRGTENLSDPYLGTEISDRHFNSRPTGGSVLRNARIDSALQSFSSAVGFYADPVDWDDDDERIHLANLNAWASYMRPISWSDLTFTEKENVPPTYSSASCSTHDSQQEQHSRSPSRYYHQSRSEHHLYSFGALRPVPTYPMPSRNISSHSPVTSAHIWYRYIGRDVESIPEQMISVNGIVRPGDETQIGFDYMDL